MKTILIYFSLFLPLVAFAQDNKINIQQIWEEYRFWARPVPGFNFMNSGAHYSRIDKAKGIVEYALSTGKETQVLYPKQENIDVGGYTFSNDESKILLETDAEKIYRYSYKANFYVWDVKGKNLKKVSDKGKQRYATLNKSADKVAFVRQNNIFYRDLKTDKEVQITRDGKENLIINGATDWVYEEEFAISRAFEWSPDGKKIAFIRFDETAVPEFTMFYYMNALYPQGSTFKYPKAGETNATVSVWIYDLDSKETIEAKIKGKAEQYLPRIVWTPDNQLCVTRMNRHQSELDLLLVNSKSGKVKTLLSEKNEYFIDINDNLTFLEGEQFVWTSDMDGYQHIYLYNMKGKQVKQLTKGEFDVITFYGVDKKRKRVYFQAAATSPTEREIYYVSLDGGDMVKLSKEAGYNTAQFSSTFDYYINKHSSIGVPPTHVIYKTESNDVVRVIEDNNNLKQLLTTYNLSEYEFFKVKTDNDIELNGWMLKPQDFDPKKQYPVFMTVYGGPGRQTVLNRWDNGNPMWYQMLAQEGYIVVSVDNRGTDARGEAFRKATYMELGKYETIDQINVAKYLGSLDYVDAERIGIFGWSFGGYLSTSCLAKGADFFKMAIAVAPVTNWKWYDTIYTERYMRTPQENNSGYEDNSPINFAKSIRGKYLLVHGMADDNVHFQHAVEMANALVKYNIPFDQAFYPNKNHGIYGGYTRSHLYNKMTNFIKDNL
ncbi:MAG: DPP IV N-terminal domain-containing protein [Saprospiraceae bacterium]|nr:DPP IV N-terminal domain-containing protein [Saprospiraceae bacterium]